MMCLNYFRLLNEMLYDAETKVVIKWSEKEKIVLNLNWYVDYDMRTVGCFLFICIGLCKYSKPNNSHSSLFKNECVIKRQNSYNNKKRVCVEAYTAIEVE